MLGIKGNWMLPALFFALTACSVGPQNRARAFDEAIRSENLSQAAAMLADEAYPGVDGELLQSAVSAGRMAKEPRPEDWRKAETRARVSVGREIYLLKREGQEWKIQCATVGPFHDRNPEMTLLLAIHFIEHDDYSSLFGLAPAALKLSESPPPRPFIAQLKRMAGELRSYFCEPFSIEGDEAELVYGSRTLRMLREGSSWRIADLW